MDLRCAMCRKRPDELSEYKQLAAEYHIQVTPADYVWLEEGTLDTHTGLFLCTPCYIKAGSPSTPNGIVAIDHEPYYREFE